MIHSIDLHLQLTQIELRSTINHLKSINRYFATGKGMTTIPFDGNGGCLEITYPASKNQSSYFYFKIIITDLHRFLNHKHILPQHKQQLENQLNTILKPFKLNLNIFTLTRIDYKLDLFTTREIRQAYLKIISKIKTKNIHRSVKELTINYNKIHQQDIDSIYLKPEGKNKNKSFNLNLYDKNLQMFEKKTYTHYIKEVLRFELQIKNTFLSGQKRSQGLSKDIDNYFTFEAMEQYMREVLIDKHLYRGDHYTIKKINKLIRHLKPKDKETVKQVVKAIDENTLDAVVREPAQFKLSSYKVKKSIELLQKLNINPIPIPVGFGIDYLKGLDKHLEGWKECFIVGDRVVGDVVGDIDVVEVEDLSWLYE